MPPDVGSQGARIQRRPSWAAKFESPEGTQAVSDLLVDASRKLDAQTAYDAETYWPLRD